MHKLLSVGLALAAGAVAGALGGNIRWAHAEGETPPRSQYFCFEASDINDLQTKANAAAQRGWHMAQAVGHPGASIWCFEQRR
ncbi:MAG TPA: hypothetical protein VGP93_16230 [Polyangiaceae bacterium]|jgi:hypothetical protein|nr:hypothetical protein [Polyangiaceae bacterium]